MGSSGETPYAALPLFHDSDKPTWRGDFNSAMGLIDAVVSILNEGIVENSADIAAHTLDITSIKANIIDVEGNVSNLTDSLETVRNGNYLNAIDFGMPGDSVDNTDSLQALLAAASTPIEINGSRGHDGSRNQIRRSVLIPSGVWNISEQLVIPEGVSIYMNPDTVIRVTAPIVGAAVTTTLDAWEGQVIEGGVIDCNELADTGLHLRVARYSNVNHVGIHDFKMYGIRVGDSSQGASCFEVGLTGVRPMRHLGLIPPVGSVGFWLDKVNDSFFSDCQVIGAELGFRVGGGNNKFSKCHVWGYPDNDAYAKTAFHDLGGAYNTYSQCVADSPSYAGWILDWGYSVLDGCSLMTHPSQVHTDIVGVRLGVDATNVRAFGCRFQGTSAALKIKADYEGVNSTWKQTSTIIGQVTVHSLSIIGVNVLAPGSVKNQVIEKTWTINGAATLGDVPLNIFWNTPVKLESLIIRAYSGSGTVFQLWKGGTQITGDIEQGFVVPINNPFGSGVEQFMEPTDGAYLKVITVGTGANFTISIKALTS